VALPDLPAFLAVVPADYFDQLVAALDDAGRAPRLGRAAERDSARRIE